ncbi:recombinase family protein [Streptococcus thermophilus]|uniref:recombinase family protein n=2 Tax=Streptococcus thermophilus TaxID=1308 RepID=UPI0022F0B3C4|nr:recombinase family protein [Streptococcus thermophilus]MCE2069455.1 recombinase family protein [Streptococcus thermophilus]MDA3720106.1 recombinase family protein [Streptococcus thermophilus]MDA3770570.1 recombinase family protein [Streptococcus thermophilus]MDA3774611.1 recombinase family protein [Streptococcus thermophilus]MDA3776498.1 recombinase family protein [Streptococcus thermophilus]
MSRIGYVRVSSSDQNLDRQVENLKGVFKVFSDKLSGKSTDRPGLKALLSFIREGDIVVVSELDRLGRNNKELTEVMSIIQSKGATIEILSLPSLSGIEDENLRRLLNNLIIELYKYQAEAERIKILERQREGIEIAKRKGRYKGRKLLFHKNDPQLQHAFKLFFEGHSDREVEQLVGINSRTFRRYREKYGIFREKKIDC